MSDTGAGAAPTQAGPFFRRYEHAMKLVLDLGPVVLMFLVYRWAGIFWATGVFMVATLVSLIVSRTLYGRVPMLPLVTGVVVMILGGLTLVLQDELFIKLKPTIAYLIFAGMALGGLAFGVPVWKMLFGEVFQLSEEGWRILQMRWGVFFLALAGVNEIAWRTLSTDGWITFKLFGFAPLVLVFALAQTGLLKRYGPMPDADHPPADRPS